MLPNCDNSGARQRALWPIGTTGKLLKTLAAAAEDLDFEIADFLAQRIAIDSEEIRRADLIPASGCERPRQERMLDLPQHTMVEAGRRQAIAKAREIRRQVPFDGGRKALLRARRLRIGHHGGLCEFGVDHRSRDCFLRIESGEPAFKNFSVSRSD